MCTDDYLEEHPCNEPYTGDRCDLLIERSITRHGSSRMVLLAYSMLISTVSLAMTILRLKDVWDVSPNGRRRGWAGLRAFASAPATQMYLGGLYAEFALAVHSIDLGGYGGRLPLLLSNMLIDQCTFGLIVVIVSGLHSWHQSLQVGKRVGDTRASRGKAALLTALFASQVGCVIAEDMYRPPDAARGVYNGHINAVKLLFLLGTMVFTLTSCTIEYTLIRRQLRKAMHARKFHGRVKKVTPTPSAAQQSSAAASEPMGGSEEEYRTGAASAPPGPRRDQPPRGQPCQPPSWGARTSAALPRFLHRFSSPKRSFWDTRAAAAQSPRAGGRKGSSAALASEGATSSVYADGGKDEDRDSSSSAVLDPGKPATGNAASAEKSHIRRVFKRHESRVRYKHMKRQDALLLQIRKYIIAIWICCLLSGVYIMTSVASRSQACYFWTDPPAVQWYDALHAIQLLSVAAFTYATLKTNDMKRRARLQIDAATTYQSINRSAPGARTRRRQRSKASNFGSERSDARSPASRER